MNPKSQTETFAAVKLLIDNWRWKGVPFYLRSGKRMPKAGSEICDPLQAGTGGAFWGGRAAQSAAQCSGAAGAAE